MSWTAITTDTSWQELAIAVDLAESYNQRRAILGLSQVATPDEDTEVNGFVLSLQTGIEAMATYFADNTAAYDDVTGLMSNYTLASAMTKAGLTTSGYWRRIPYGSTQPSDWTTYNGYGYGKIADSDLAGPWLFKDLQLAMSVLTRRIVSTTLTNAANTYCRASKGQTWLTLTSATYWPTITGTIASNTTASSDDFGFSIYKWCDYDQGNDEASAGVQAHAQRGYASTSGLGTQAHKVRLLLTVHAKTGSEAFAGLRYTSTSGAAVGKRYCAYESAGYEYIDAASCWVLNYYEGWAWNNFCSLVTWPSLQDGQLVEVTASITFKTAAQFVLDYLFSDS